MLDFFMYYDFGYFILKLVICLVIGFGIGAERESRGKMAGISTHIYVIAGAMLFTSASQIIAPDDPARIAAGIVTGIGFLGAGIILHQGAYVQNVTTAASIWFSAAIGILIGIDQFLIAIICGVFSFLVPSIPHLPKHTEHHDR